MIQILLATWNSSRFLGEQLDSLFAQSCGDFEILIHDGGSEDDTLDVIRRYEQRYPGRIRFLGSHKEDACSNFARLLAAADGEWIMFCDHDDVWKKEKILRSWIAAQNALREAGNEQIPLLVFTDLEVVDEKLNILHPSMMRSQRLNRSCFTPQHLLIQNAVTGNTMLFNKALRDLAVPIPAGALMHDYFVTLCAAFFGKIVYVDEPLISYRQHGSNVIGAFRYNLFSLFRKLWASPGKVRASLFRKMEQGALVLEAHPEKLGEKERTLLAGLQKFKSMNFLERRLFFFRNHFCAEGFLRNLGWFLFL